MKKHFKPLSTGDVVVALISQQSTPDGLEGLKEYLCESSKAVLVPDRQAEELVLLPPFAIQQMNEYQLLMYHFERGNFNSSHLCNYQSLLEGVDAKMRKIIGTSSSSFERSNQIIEEMILKLRQFCQFVSAERKPLSLLTSHLKKKYLTILRKIVKIRNMEKTLDVMKFWNQSKISTVLTIRPQNIRHYPNIAEVFYNFDQIIQVLGERRQEFSNFANLISLVQGRRKEIIEKIYQNALNSIVQYTTDEDLKIKKEQYSFIIRERLLENPKPFPENCSIFDEQHLPQLIESNIYTLYQKNLNKNGLDINIELVRDHVFLQFYQEMLKDYQRYFSNWHKVTTFHIHTSSPQQQGFIQLRTAVFMKMLEKIETSLKYSNKVNSLSLPKLIHLFSIIASFMRAGEEWMGKCKTVLPEILRDKCQSEVNTFFKVKNGELKSTLLMEFNINTQKMYMASDLNRQKTTIKEQMKGLLTELQAETVDLAITAQLFHFDKNNSINVQSLPKLSLGSLQSEICSYLDRLNTKLGVRLFRSILLYTVRQQYFPHLNQLSLIYQHFEYILMIIYKMCIPMFMKRDLEQEMYNQFNRTNKIAYVKGALQRSQVDEQTILAINELRHGFLDRSTYGILYDFIAANQGKYEGISLTSYVNPNLYYQQPQKYENQLSILSQSYAMVMSQLYILSDYVENLGSSSRFPKTEVDLHHQLMNLKNVIASLVLFYFTTYLQLNLKKFYTQVMPLFSGIKFQVKKLQEFKANLKDYKARAVEMYHTMFSIDRYSRLTCFYLMLLGKQREYFYKFIIDLFSRIQKINDNGRHILRQEANQIGKEIGMDATGEDNWYETLIAYLDLSQERNEKTILTQVEKGVLQYPIQWWRSNVVWYYNDCSAKEKKDFLCKLAHVYLNRLVSLPKI